MGWPIGFPDPFSECIVVLTDRNIRSSSHLINWNMRDPTFTGAKSGDKSMAFTQKVLGKGHATARLLLRNGRVYHLFSRLVYRATGRENLRNRREHSAEHIRTKLAVLDFVLAHQEYRYLETETEKVDYFCRKLSIGRALLPARRYTRERSGKRPRTVISLTNSRCSLLLNLHLFPLWSPSVL